MNVQTLIACTVIVCAFLIIRYRQRRQQEEPEPVYDTADLTDAIHALAALSDQLENADRMIADLHACNPCELIRGFRAEWSGIDGKRRHIDFLADGQNGATAGLMQAAQESRDRINAEIIELVRAMGAALDDGSAPALQLDAVGETVDETTAAANAGEW